MKPSLICEVPKSLSDTHTSSDSSLLVIDPLQRPLPDKTHHSQQTDIRVPVGFEPVIPASERPWNHALNLSATEMDKCS
jgi:hypothetical protein